MKESSDSVKSGSHNMIFRRGAFLHIVHVWKLTPLVFPTMLSVRIAWIRVSKKLAELFDQQDDELESRNDHFCKDEEVLELQLLIFAADHPEYFRSKK